MGKKKIKKETIQVELSLKDKKPQNVTAMALSNFSGGVHQKTNKAKRKQEKMKMKKEISDFYKNVRDFLFR